MDDITPTRSGLLALKEERQAMDEAFAFLDEKRMLLAAEIVAQLRAYAAAMHGFRTSFETAVEALKTALAWHGLDELQCYPAAGIEGARLDIVRRSLLGVALLTAELKADGSVESPGSSPEAEQCKECFKELTQQAAHLAALSGNLRRLYNEYRRTERRARALEDVLLPELEQALVQIEAQLEALDLEEAVRVRAGR